MNYDAILSYLGEFGPYQRWKVFFLALTGIPCGIHTCTVIFNMVEPPFRCAVPGLDNDTFHIQNEAHRQLVNTSVPFDDDIGQFSQCSVYRRYVNGTDTRTDTNQIVKCDRWVYDPEYTSASVVDDWDLVCDNKSYRTHCNMLVLLGFLVGSLYGGTLADTFGRKKVLLILLVIQVLLGTGAAFVTSIYQYMAMRFLLPSIAMATYLVSFVLLAEIVGPKWRTFAEICDVYGYNIGLFVLVIICVSIQNWRIEQLVGSVPCIALVSLWWLVDESPRWLMVKGRMAEARRIMEVIAKVNGTKIPEDLEIESTIEKNPKKNGNSDKVWHILTNRRLAIRMFILLFGWVSSAMVYFGLTLNLGTLVEGSIYVSFSVQAALEITGNGLVMALINRTRRRTIYCVSFLGSGVACLAMTVPIFTQSDIKAINVLLFGLGKFSITFAFMVVYIVTTALLPTTIRNSGLGICSCVGRIAAAISPYVAILGYSMSSNYGATFPLFVFAAFAITAGLLALLLPETKNLGLPEIIDDCKNIKSGKNVIYKPSQDTKL